MSGFTSENYLNNNTCVTISVHVDVKIIFFKMITLRMLSIQLSVQEAN